MRSPLLLGAALILFAECWFIVGVLAQNFTDEQLVVVQNQLAAGASHSWEYGTRAEALLELNAPSYSVFYPSPLPPPQTIPSGVNLTDVLDIARTIVANRSISNGNITGPQPLIADTAAGDPCSIGVAVLLANWTGQGAIDGLDYAGAARDQLEFIMSRVPQTKDGAISHRVAQLQLWSDSVYMVPPFLAYYGVVTGNQTLLLEAYTQISLYRNYLRDAKSNLWEHVMFGTGEDLGHWATGNGWAAAGMLRVLATMQRSQWSDDLYNLQSDLATWVDEIHGGMYAYLNTNGIFYNWVDQPDSFYDASSAALLASTVYRLSQLWNVHTHIPIAEQVRRALAASANTTVDVKTYPPWPATPTATATSTSPTASSPSSSASGSPSNSSSASGSSTSAPPSSSSAPSSQPSTNPMQNMLYFTSDGWLTPVVNPDSYGEQGSQSPESEAFILELQAAWTDWVQAGTPGANSARAGVTVSQAVVTIAGLVIGFSLLY